MPGVRESTDALRAALRKKGVEDHVQDAFDNLASCLVLLNSSFPSVQMIRKLCTVLRQPFLLLYTACLQPALLLSTSVLSTVLGKLCDAQNAEDESLRTAWDATAEVILSGILDFLDQEDSAHVESDCVAWEVLCRTICQFFFLDSGHELPAFSIPLCLSAYNLLTETAARQITVRNALRQRSVLGGERLGATISGTRDYLLLEALLVLFARLLPPTHGTSQGKFRRIRFLQEVLGSPKLFKCSAALLDIMQKTSEIHWDNVSAQIIDALARSDITYPQPFATDEIHVCGRVFPQPLATDRLIMDRQAFLADVVVENEALCESLQVPYSYIRTITLDNSVKIVPKGKVSIMVYLTAPPLVANVKMKTPDASHLHAKFLLQNDALGRFMEALRRRSVGKLSFLNPLTRTEGKRKSISVGSGFRFTNDSSPIPPTASFEGKVQHVNQVYKTDIEDPTTFQAAPLPHVGGASSSPTTNLKPLFKDDMLVPEVLEAPATKDSPAKLPSTRLIPSTNEVSNPTQNFALLCIPGNSTRTTHLFGDNGEPSEISEFEANDNTASERAATGVSGSCHRRLKQTQHGTDCMRMDVNSSATCEGTKTSFDSVTKPTDHSQGVVHRSSELEKLLSTSDSPVFCASSSTQIDASPKLLSNTDTLLASTEVVDGLSLASKDLIGTDLLKNSSVNECGPSDAELNTVSTQKFNVESSSAKDQPGQRITYFVPSPNANQEVHSRIKNPKDTGVPPKIAGTRRKRGPVKASSKLIIEVNDDYTPPRKKSRRDRCEIEDKVKSNVPVSRAKKYTKSAERSSPGVDPTVADFNELAELKPTHQGTRKSLRIKKRQTAATDPTRSSATRGKTLKGKQVISQSVSRAERKKLATASLRDTGVETGDHIPSVLTLRPIPPAVRQSPFPKINSPTPLVELSSAGSITQEADLPREMPEGDSSPTCSSAQPSVTSGKDPRGGLGFIQETALDAMQLNQERFRIKKEEVVDDRHIVPDVRTIDNEVNLVQGVIKYSVTSNESEDLVEPIRPTMELTSRKGVITIDLTRDDSPTRENNGPHKTSVDPVHAEVDIQMKFGTPDLCNTILIKEPSFAPYPRNRRQSVTFASPIEYALEKKTKSNAHVGSPSFARSPRPSSPSEGSTLSPLRIPVRTGNVRGSPSRIIFHTKAPIYDQIADEVEVQDIVEVLNEIQSVIIRGISDKFRNVKKDVQHSRDELIQQVLDELRGMIVENAQYFNGLLRLEEDYYKNCKAIICCWEELIDCNDGIAVQFQNVLREHDQNISARTFPRSLLPMQPVFPRRRVNA